MWPVATTIEFDDWFAELGEPDQVEVMAKVQLLRVVGPALGRPHADTLKGSKYENMKELRARTKGAVIRIAFAFDAALGDSSVCRQEVRGESEAVLQAIDCSRGRTLCAPLGPIPPTDARRNMSMAKSFEDLVMRTTTKRAREEAARRSRALLSELFLAEIRKQSGTSQSELARTLGIKQPSLSKLEQQNDMQISTLKRIIAALGGELEIFAQFPDRAIKLRQRLRASSANRRPLGRQ